MLYSFFRAILRVWIYFNSPSISLIRRYPCNVSIFRRAIFTFNWLTWNFVFARKDSLPYLSPIASAVFGANRGARCQSRLKTRGENLASRNNSTVSWSWAFWIFAFSSLASYLYIASFLVVTSTKTSQAGALGRRVPGGELPAILSWGGSVRSSSVSYICTSRLIWLRSRGFSLIRIRVFRIKVIFCKPSWNVGTERKRSWRGTRATLAAGAFTYITGNWRMGVRATEKRPWNQMPSILSQIQPSFLVGVLEVSTAARDMDQKLRTLVQNQVSLERLFMCKILSLLAGGRAYRYLVAFFCRRQSYISLITINRKIREIETLQIAILPCI